MTWKERYKKIYEEYSISRYPAATKDFGVLPVKYPKVTSANGLSTLTENVFNWQGHHMERTSNMGRPADKRKTYVDVIGRIRVIGSIEWQKGTGTKGTSDLKGEFKSKNHAYPIPLKVEVKYGKDRQSEPQKEYQKKVTSIGAIYWIVSYPEDVFELYDYLMTL